MRKLSNTKESQIEILRIEYNMIVARALGSKEKYFEYIAKANTVLSKISIIKKKEEFKKKYGKENGFSDGFDKVFL